MNLCRLLLLSRSTGGNYHSLYGCAPSSPSTSSAFSSSSAKPYCIGITRCCFNLFPILLLLSSARRVFISNDFYLRRFAHGFTSEICSLGGSTLFPLQDHFIVHLPRSKAPLNTTSRSPANPTHSGLSTTNRTGPYHESHSQSSRSFCFFPKHVSPARPFPAQSIHSSPVSSFSTPLPPNPKSQPPNRSSSLLVFTSDTAPPSLPKKVVNLFLPPHFLLLLERKP